MQIENSNTSLNLTKVAEILRISRPLALKLVNRGVLPCVRGVSGIRVLSQDLEKWVEEQLPPELANY